MRKQKTAREKALFRFSVISKVLSLTGCGKSLSIAVRNVAEELHFDIQGHSKRVSRRSIYRWLGTFKNGEFEDLFDSPKKRSAFSDVLPKELEVFLRRQKADDPSSSIPELIRRAEKLQILKDPDRTSRTTVWRACHRLGLPMTRGGSLKYKDMRRFSYENRMQMVLCDGKHFKVGPNRTKRVAIVFLDDATRYGLHSVCGPSESKALFLKGLFEVIKRHGKMVMLFVDNGSGFIAADTLEICARLKITLIHGEAGYPEGHGKIERFNRTLKQDLLKHLDQTPGMDESCASLDLRIQNYLKESYGKRFHEGLGDVPEDRFFGDKRPLEFPASIPDLKHYFILRETRKVSKDNIVRLDGSHYEMPLGYAGTEQEIRRHILEEKNMFLHEGRLIELCCVDLKKNAGTRRLRPMPAQFHKSNAPLKDMSSASMDFEKNYKPIINSDGGYHNKEYSND